MSMLDIVSDLANAIVMLTDKVHELNPGADLSGIRRSTVEALDSARKFDDAMQRHITNSQISRGLYP